MCVSILIFCFSDPCGGVLGREGGSNTSSIRRLHDHEHVRFFRSDGQRHEQEVHEQKGEEGRQEEDEKKERKRDHIPEVWPRDHRDGEVQEDKEKSGDDNVVEV